MRTIVIERVSNGWIVRPFSFNPTWGPCDQPSLAVYVTIEELQRDLPKLIDVPNDQYIAPESMQERYTPDSLLVPP